MWNKFHFRGQNTEYCISQIVSLAHYHLARLYVCSPIAGVISIACVLLYPPILLTSELWTNYLTVCEAAVHRLGLTCNNTNQPSYILN